MLLSAETSQKIVQTSLTYLGKPYDYKTFDCIHFIVSVYRDVGIIIPRFGGSGPPPTNINLSAEEFERMPLGHPVFFKRKLSTSNRIWTHAALILSSHEFIHGSRFYNNKIVITEKD